MNIWDELKEQHARAVATTAPWLPLIEALLGQVEDLSRRVEELENTVTAPAPVVEDKRVTVDTTGSIANYYGEVSRPATSDKPEPYIIRNGKKLPFRGQCALVRNGVRCTEPVYSVMKGAQYCCSKHGQLAWYYAHKDDKKQKVQRHGTPNGVSVVAGEGVKKGQV